MPALVDIVFVDPSYLFKTVMAPALMPSAFIGRGLKPDHGVVPLEKLERVFGTTGLDVAQVEAVLCAMSLCYNVWQGATPAVFFPCLLRDSPFPGAEEVWRSDPIYAIHVGRRLVAQEPLCLPPGYMFTAQTRLSNLFGAERFEHWHLATRISFDGLQCLLLQNAESDVELKLRAAQGHWRQAWAIQSKVCR